MKKLFLLLAVIIAIGCKDNTIEEPSIYDPKIAFNGNFAFNLQEDGNDTAFYRARFKTANNLFTIESISDSDLPIASILSKSVGTYTGIFTDKDFTGNFIDDMNTKHNLYIVMLGGNYAYKGEISQEKQSGEILKFSFRGGKSL